MKNVPGPDFLCIGAIKSGTGWLWANLRAHPDVWMPPIKELRYFDELQTNLRARLMLRDEGRDDYDYSYWRRKLNEFLHNWRGWVQPRHVWWHLRYFFGRRNPRWYASLFAPAAAGQVAGEATPLYAPMPEERIAFAARHFPHLKLVYLLRDPIERAWSHVLMRCLDLPEVDRDADKVTKDVVRRAVRKRGLNDDWLFQNGRYADNLRRWQRHFSSEQILVCFHEELKRNAVGLLRRVLRFLGKSRFNEIDRALIRKRFNPRPVDLEIPPAIETFFARRLIDDLRVLAGRVGSPATAWLARAQHACAR